MKKKLRFVFSQTVLIAFCELLFVSVLGVLSKVGEPSDGVYFPWYLPFSLVFIAVVTALPGLLLYELEEARYWRLRIAAHFVLLGAGVLAAGRFFRWYRSLGGGAVIFLVFCTIYVFVWAMTSHSYQRDDERINERLAQNRQRGQSGGGEPDR